MSPTTIEPDAQEAEIRRRSDELVEITKAITTTEGDLRELRDERRVIYRALLDAVLRSVPESPRHCHRRHPGELADLSL